MKIAHETNSINFEYKYNVLVVYLSVFINGKCLFPSAEAVKFFRVLDFCSKLHHLVPWEDFSGYFDVITAL
jgi:hypothetical protein